MRTRMKVATIILAAQPLAASIVNADDRLLA